MPTILIDTLGAVGFVVAAFGFYGWGRAVRRLVGLPTGTWPVSIALGIAAAIFAGGILSLLHLAYPWALDTLLIIGAGFAIDALRRDGLSTVSTIWPASRAERR